MISLAQPKLGEKELEQIATVFDRGKLTRGPEVDAFETEFAEFCNASHGVATTNGTSALHAALQALRLGTEDRVATTSFSFIPTANAIRWCGAEPTFLDVRDDTYLIDLDALEARLRDGGQIDAVVAVHLFGLACNMERLLELADEFDFYVIEDAAQAHGAMYDGSPVGSFGDVACFSFFATKNMTTGEGGMIVTNRSGVVDRTRQFIEHGRTDEGYAGLGHNFCMSDITAAIGRIQLQELPEMNRARRLNADYLTEGLRDSPVVPPVDPSNRDHVYHIYTIQTDARDDVRAHLRDQDIETGIYYETPIHEQPAYSDYNVSLPVVESLKDRVLALPVHHHLSNDDLDRIIQAVTEYWKD